MARARSPILVYVTLIGVVASLLLAACGDAEPGSEREADIYAAVIRALVPPDDDTTRVTKEVFIGGGDGGVPLDLQADVLQELGEYERLRFVDDRAEAVEEDPPHLVRNHGVYLEIGAIPERGTRVDVDALRYVDDDNRERLRVRVVRVAGAWTVDEVSET